MVQDDYTVRLGEVFHGPMDLLLHLVREQEVDIHEIELGRIIDGYLEYLAALREVDLELAGDFVFMAATLMAIKMRSLLPTGEEVDLEEELDPRDELIQRLIEYRNFKRASGELHDRFQERGSLFGREIRGERRSEPVAPVELDFGELTQWDLLGAYSRLMRETLVDRALQIAPDERPLRFYVKKLAAALQERSEMSLRDIVRQAVGEDGQAARQVLVGTFCALLELMKIGVASAVQERSRDEIRIRLRADFEGDLDQIIRSSGFDDELEAAEGLEGGGAQGGEPPATPPPG